ncbi:MAG: LysR family transcriptional regulator [Rhizobacter sp.]|nr:LysR family transcriptional regulator [Rhizobacter sp.]
MRLTLRQLRVFVAVADAGTTTSAGEALGLSQSATSGALNELETMLGARFFDRIGKRLLLNDNGRALLSQSRALLDAAASIERQFRAQDPAEAGADVPTQLRVGASTTIGNYLLPTLVASYRRAWPRTGITVQIGNTQEVAAAVARFEVDLGLIEGPCHEPELRVRPWLEDELVIVCAPTHPLMREVTAGRVSLKLLRQAQWLLREPGSGTREAVEQALLPHLHALNSER